MLLRLSFGHPNHSPRASSINPSYTPLPTLLHYSKRIVSSVPAAAQILDMVPSLCALPSWINWKKAEGWKLHQEADTVARDVFASLAGEVNRESDF